MKIKSFSERVLSIVVAIFLVIAILPMWKKAEVQLFPVVDNFVVNTVRLTDTGVKVSGEMTKLRNCDLNGLSIYGTSPVSGFPHLLEYDVQNNNIGPRVSGPQSWGPWSIFIQDISNDWKVTIYANHKCHSLYSSTSKLTTFTVGKNKK